MKRLRWMSAFWFAIMFVAVLLSGCVSRPAGSPAASLPSPEPAGANSQVTPAAIKASRLTATLKSSSGKQAQVFIYAPDEKADLVDAPSCMANHGDTLRTGSYALYLTPENKGEPIRQSVAPHGGEPLMFNDQRPQALQVLPGGTDKQPDLLVIAQYGSCSMDSVSILALAPDGRTLVSYPFKTADGHLWPTQGTKGVEHPQPGVLRTSFYNNATGKTTTTTWEVREADALLVAVASDVR